MRSIAHAVELGVAGQGGGGGGGGGGVAASAAKNVHTGVDPVDR